MIISFTSKKPFRLTIKDARKKNREPQTAISRQRPIEADGSRADDDWYVGPVIGQSLYGHALISIEPLDVQSGEKSVRVYEDRAGHLFLWKEGDPFFYQDDPFQTGMTIEKDAQAIYEGETGNWSLKWVHPRALLQTVLQNCRTIATWHPAGFVEYHEPAGAAGKKFLGIDDPDEEQ